LYYLPLLFFGEGVQVGEIGKVFEAEELVGITKKLSNPVSNLIVVPIQFNFNHGLIEMI